MTIKAKVKAAIEKIESNKTRINYKMMYDADYIFDNASGLSLVQIKRALYALKKDGYLDSTNMSGVYVIKEKTVSVKAKIGTHGSGEYEVKPPENIVTGGLVAFRLIGHSNWSSGRVNKVNDDGLCFIEYV